MKKLLLLFALMISVTLVSGQKSIDALFEKYAGKDGFTTLTINGNLIKLLSCLGDDEDLNSIPAGTTQIRILSQDDDDMKVDNFYDLVIKDIDLTSYDEFMTVKESKQEMRMLVRTEGNRFREFLLISGGEDNAIIQIKGDMTFAEAKKLSHDVKSEHSINFVANHK
jgi:hypothetical protein